MNNYFTDNFVDYDDPPIDSNNLTPDTRDFSLSSPHSDSTGLFASAQSPESYQAYVPSDQLNFEFMPDYNQQQQVTPQIEFPETSKKGGRRKAHPVATPAYTDLSSENSADGKIMDKSKRIQKRTVAKERTKQKQDLTAMFAGIDSKFLPEGYDDPNLDERAKKKMIQMVRNRISAQNSRDRKKDFMTQLQEINAKLEAEKDELQVQLKNAQEEIQILKSNGVGGLCRSCQTKLEEGDDFILTGNDNELQEIPAGGFSGLSSPRLARFASSRSGFLGMFAFLGIIAMVAVVNIGQQEPFGLQSNGMSHLKDIRVLEAQNQKVVSPVKESPNYITQIIPDYSNSFILQNIDKIMSQFEKNYEPTFKSHLQNSPVLNGITIQEVVKKVDTIEPMAIDNDFKNGIVQYDSSRASNNLRKNRPVLANTPPAVADTSAHTSTLFCSSGHEFYDNGSQNVHIPGKGDLVKNNTLDLEKADYLQLLVPKGTIARSNANHRLTDIYGQDIYTDSQSDDTMLEIWCKVFLVREIGPSY